MGTVSVVICTYNRSDFLPKCMNSVIFEQVPGAEVIIVDDGSTDRTTEVLAEYENNGNVKVLRNEHNIGLTRSRNIGVSISTSDLVAFVDSDCVVHEGWLKELIKPFGMDENIMIVGGEIQDGPITNYWELSCKGVYKLGDKSGYVDKIIGTNMAFRRAFLSDNKFDETLKYGADETDLCMRARQAGYGIYYQKSAQVTHFHRNTFTGMVKQRFFQAIGNCYFRHKYRIFPLIPFANLLLFPGIFIVLLIPGVLRIYLLITVIALVLAKILSVELKRNVKSHTEIILSLPGMMLMCLSDSAGYLWKFLRGFKGRN